MEIIFLRVPFGSTLIPVYILRHVLHFENASFPEHFVCGNGNVLLVAADAHLNGPQTAPVPHPDWCP